MFLAEILEFYRTNHVLVRCKDARARCGKIELIKGIWGHLRPQDIGLPECRDYFDQRFPTMATTVTNELALVNAACRHAVEYRKLPPEHLPRITYPQTEPVKPTWFLMHELRQLLESEWNVRGGKGRENYLFIKTAYYTAGRHQAVVNLEWSQFDWDAKEIDLAKPGESQTRKRKAVVPIDPELLPDLRDAHRYKDNGNYVFGRRFGRLQLFDQACERAGLAKLPWRRQRPERKPTIHTLRHSRATHLLQAGKDPYAVAELLGDTLQTVLRVYGHHCPSNTAERLGFKYPLLDAELDNHPAFA